MIRASWFTDFRPAPGERPSVDQYERVMDLVKLSDELGYDTFWTTEQHGVDDGYLPAQLPVLAALARETDQIKLGTGVIVLPLAQPRRVVEEACVVDVLSHGRLRLGLGAGNYPKEFQAFGVTRADRARLMEEGIAFIRQGLDGSPLHDGLPVNVPPAQSRIPLLVGCIAKKAIDRAVRLADGHYGYSMADPENELPMQWRERIAPALEAHGRTPDDFELAFTTVIWASDDYEAEWKEHVGPAFLFQQERYASYTADVPSVEGYLDVDNEADLDKLMGQMLIGPPAEIADRLNAIHDEYPFHEIVIEPLLPGVPYELAERFLRTFRDDVVPKLKGNGGPSGPG